MRHSQCDLLLTCCTVILRFEDGRSKAQYPMDAAGAEKVKHFFSFAENMIQRSYRRYQEISPELEALYLGGKREDAVKFLLREQESITRDAVDKLKKSIKEEGYDLENIEK